MRQSLIVLGIILGTLIGLFSYCAILIDWIQDYHSNNLAETLLETAAILIYSYAGVNFYKRRLAQ